MIARYVPKHAQGVGRHRLYRRDWAAVAWVVLPLLAFLASSTAVVIVMVFA
ncbi:hypothetical protein [Microbacterium sp.]|uniref:hypothetical protein n=1 Tax=Microbacterium sp. TaxID=51671 RepID=UPI003A95744D